MTSFHDYQRDRLYAAADLAEADSREGADELLPSEVSRFAAAALAAAGWADSARPSFQFDVTPAHPLRAWVDANDRVIHLDPSSLSRWTVLHELAHWVDMRDGHGPRFCANFLELVRGALGTEASASLRAAFQEEGVAVDEEWLTF